MVTTTKWVREATARRFGGHGADAISERDFRSNSALPLLVLAGLVVLVALGGAGCSEPPGQVEWRRGRQLLAQGRATEAIPPLRRASDLLATNTAVAAHVLNHLGLAYHQAGDRESARRAYQAAINADINLFAARYNLGCLLLEEGDAAGAARELSAYVAQRPEDPSGWVRLGSARLRLGQVNAAAEAFQRAGERATDPRVQAEALNGAAVCLWKQGNTNHARVFLEAAAKLQPGWPPALFNLAVLAEQTGDVPAALAHYQSWLESAPADHPQRRHVADHLRQLATALQPALAEGSPDAAEQYRRLTNLFARVGSVSPPGGPAAPSPQPTPASTGAVTAVAPPPANTQAPEKTNARPAEPPPSSVETAAAPPAETVSPPAPPAVPTVSLEPPSLPASSNAVLTGTLPAVSSVGGSTVAAGPFPSPAPGQSVAGPAEQAPATTNQMAEMLPASAPGTQAGSPAGTVPSPGGPTERTAGSAPSPERGATTEVAVVEVRVSEPEPLTLAAPPVVTPAVQPVAPNEPTASPERTGARGAAEEETSRAEAPKKPSFLSRLNPLRLFRRGTKEGDTKKERHLRITPLPPLRESAVPAGVESLAPESAPPASPPVPQSQESPEPQAMAAAPSALPAAAPALPEFPRYPRLSPPRPAAGDTAKARQWLLEAAAAHRAARYEEAAQLYVQAIQADPASFDAHYNLGTLELQRDRPRLALPELETALVLDPDSIAARFNFALALEKAGYPLDAALEMERVVAAQPDNVEAHLMLGGLYANTLRDEAKARLHFGRVIALAPDHPQSRAIRRWLSAHHP